jgi:hypothetical protein
MDVNKGISYECSDEDTYTQHIHISSTRSHASEEKNRTGHRGINCKCKVTAADIMQYIIKEASYSSMRDVRGTSTWTIPRNRTIKTFETKFDWDLKKKR